MDFKLYQHIFVGGHSARFRKISTFLLGPIIYAISVRPPYCCIVTPGIDFKQTTYCIQPQADWSINSVWPVMPVV
jgi:hypothetical protein